MCNLIVDIMGDGVAGMSRARAGRTGWSHAGGGFLRSDSGDPSAAPDGAPVHQIQRVPRRALHSGRVGLGHSGPSHEHVLVCCSGFAHECHLPCIPVG